MQIKTIDKIVRKKMDDWLESITDKKLRKEVKDVILVSGGCIASMFLQEDINDFDVYIQSQDTLVKLAEYYSKTKSIVVFDGRDKEKLILQMIPLAKDLKDFEMHRGQIKDFDMHTYSKLMALEDNQVKLDIPDEGFAYKVLPDDLIKKPFQVVFLSPNAISLSNKVQIILRFSGDAEEVHKNFDFIHATNYWTYADGVVTNKKALESLLTKQLFYQGSLYPLTSILRMKKFVIRKWKISAGEVFKIMWQIADLDLRDSVSLTNQLIGVDIAYFADLIEKLNQREPKEWDADYINRNIDEVFNKHDGEE